MREGEEGGRGEGEWGEGGGGSDLFAINNLAKTKCSFTGKSKYQAAGHPTKLAVGKKYIS